MKRNILVTSLLLIPFLFSNLLNAQESDIKKYENGTVLISYIGTYLGQNFESSNEPYSPYLLGVYYDDNPDGEINPRMYRIPIKKNGITWAKYTNVNGEIKKGDPITSSAEPGLAMKATEPGVILGIALEDAVNPNGLVKIRVMIQYMR